MLRFIAVALIAAACGGADPLSKLQLSTTTDAVWTLENESYTCADLCPGIGGVTCNCAQFRNHQCAAGVSAGSTCTTSGFCYRMTNPTQFEELDCNQYWHENIGSYCGSNCPANTCPAGTVIGHSCQRQMSCVLSAPPYAYYLECD